MIQSNYSRRILTGIQSTGIPHLGNLLGAILPALELAKASEDPAFFFIANLHTLTSQQDPSKVLYYTQAATATWLACGINIHKDFIYRQSMIPEVCELAWYLNCLTPYPMLANAHAFKRKSENLSYVNAGIFTYPVLMAADIILYNATHVPVGKDQQQHLEIARDLARSFNNIYQPILVVPEVLLKENVATLPGIDGRKMSKSYNNTINVFATEKELYKTIMRITTDNTSLADPKDPDTCNVFQLYRVIAPSADVASMHERYLTGGYGYQTAKKELLQAILVRFSEERQVFNYYMNTPEILAKILQASEEKVHAVAHKNLVSVRKAMGVS